MKTKGARIAATIRIKGSPNVANMMPAANMSSESSLRVNCFKIFAIEYDKFTTTVNGEMNIWIVKSNSHRKMLSGIYHISEQPKMEPGLK